MLQEAQSKLRGYLTPFSSTKNKDLSSIFLSQPKNIFFKQCFVVIKCLSLKEFVFSTEYSLISQPHKE